MPLLCKQHLMPQRLGCATAAPTHHLLLLLMLLPADTL
jgi:hypothetical protein